MADRGDTHYRVPKLNGWFAVSSIALLLSSVWMVLEDFSRPWKEYQREFQEIEIERARAELTQPEAVAALEEEQRLAEELKAAESHLRAENEELARARQELVDLRATQFNATEDAKKAKQEYNWERYRTEEYRLHHGDGPGYQEVLLGLQEYEDRMAELTGEKQVADAAVQAKLDEIATHEERVIELETAMKSAAKGVDLARKKLEQIDPADLPTKVANIVRDDIPGLDFIGPRIQVKKVLPPDLTFDLNFTRKQRIDMCQTCHLAADREGFDDVEQPFRSHPRLDLYLSAKSPHPLSEVGCTICHRGAGEALDFQRADHRASDEVEAEEWQEEYHWHKQHYWDYPMLASGYVEASCVQCHKDSMELVSDEAPRVAKGFQLFERYGCYACHKVEWFPTERRPGPSLKNVLQKTDADFVSSWIRNPKAFRPTTWMPQIFHLENYEATDEIVVSEWGTGRTMMGDEWSNAAVAAVSAFVQSRSGTEPAPEIPVDGDAVRGREVFRLTGCLACHNTVPYTKAARAAAEDPADQLRDTNEHGPNLRGIATKVTPEWLFAWIKDPSRYWSETRMPNLRLSDQDAADIVAYVFDDPDGIFHDVPAGWEPAEPAFQRDVLEEQARWFFNRELRSVLESRFENEWADDETLLEVVGERWVLNQGCHSCHEIEGLENAQPIGTELTAWGSKTVDKLDFGFIPEIRAEERGLQTGSNEFHHFTVEFKSYRENFLEQKLKEPRSFDQRKIKNPTERLRMPWFGLTTDQVKSIATFVVGLVTDEVQHAKMVPSHDEVARNDGRRVVRQKNCAACHVIEPATITFTDEEGERQTVRGNIQVLDERVTPPPTQNFREHLEAYVQWMRENEDEEFELEGLAVLVREPTPGVGDVNDLLYIEDVDSVEVEPAWGGDFVDVVTGYYLDPTRTGDPEGQGRVQDVNGAWRNFENEPYDKVRWAYAPPLLVDEGAKLQPDWFHAFLLDPVTLRQQIRVRMPTFDWAPGEAAAVADFFAYEAEKEWPRRFARSLLVDLDLTPEELAREVSDMGLSGTTAEQIVGITEGKALATEAGRPNLRAYALAVGYETTEPVDPAYEAIMQRSPSTREELLSAMPDFYERVHRLVTVPEGPKCTQCHYLLGEPPSKVEDPIEWAPDLLHARERLRPDWVREWLTNPASIYPGTAMPENFPAGQVQYQDLYPGSSAEQIEALVDWLFNLDQAVLRGI